MRNPFKRKQQERQGIPTADEEPRIASTQIPETAATTESEAEAPLPGPDVLPTHTEEVDAKFAGKSPEELCDVDISMPVEEIRESLAKLFTRHNRAASSFDLELRAEAEIMLQAIVTVREKYVERL